MPAKLELDLDPALAAEARALGVDAASVAAEAVAHAVKVARNRRWAEENRAALDAYAERIERDGLTLERWRLF